MYTRFWWANLRERDNLSDPGVDVRVILKSNFKMWVEGMVWFDLAQDRYKWWGFVNAVMNLRAP